MNNLLYEFLDFDNLKEILDSQIFNWNPTKDIPDIYPNKNEKTRISEYVQIRNKKILQQVMNCFNEANKFYNVKLNGTVSVKLQRYKSLGYMDWHIDEQYEKNKNSKKRLLTMSLLLNDDFIGGKMLVKNKQKGITEYTGPLGTAIIFPSDWLHKVEPLVEGNRNVLTAWAYGEL